jgi:predicted dehydrogenase
MVDGVWLVTAVCAGGIVGALAVHAHHMRLWRRHERESEARTATLQRRIRDESAEGAPVGVPYHWTATVRYEREDGEIAYAMERDIVRMTRLIDTRRTVMDAMLSQMRELYGQNAVLVAWSLEPNDIP